MSTFSPEQSYFLSGVFNNSKAFKEIFDKSVMEALGLKKEILSVEMYDKPYDLLSPEAVQLIQDAGKELNIDVLHLFPEISFR